MAATNKSHFHPHAEEVHRAARAARLVELFGTLEWDDSVDHKEDRRSRDRKLGLID
jgi:hypothetical protein